VSGGKFFDKTGLLRCPVCGTAFSRSGNALRCENGHTFDVSRKGYVHFAPNASPSRYDEALFASRRRILEAGFYDAVIDAVRAAMPADAGVVLDAGCGDGTFTKALSRETTFGLDLSKDAILLAARGGGPILWTVGDLTKLPLADASVDVILNLFSPAHYAEFARVLKPGGKLLKLVPQEGYLREIRALMADRLHREAYSNDAVVSHLSAQFHVADRIRISECYSLTEEQARDFLFMTPLTFGTDPGMLDASLLKEITIDVELLIADRPDE
jgi:23S rRNA (guanine745-N1)-methyltransferase